MANDVDTPDSIPGKRLISRADAIALDRTRYFTGKPCQHGHVAERNVARNNECQECKRARDTKYAQSRAPQKAAYDRQYRADNQDRRRENRVRWEGQTVEQRAVYQREYRLRNAERLASYRKARQEQRRQIKQAWSDQNRDHIRIYANSYDKKAKAERPNYRLACALRTRLAVAVRSETRAGSAVRDLGCSIEFLRSYLEDQFQDGMAWANWGRKGWQIDHRRPLASFDLADPEQLRAACHYTNLQPLWAVENASKGANYQWADAHEARAG